MKPSSVTLFFCLTCASVGMVQDRGLVDCQGRTGGVTALAEPGSMYVTKQLSCGRTVSIIGLERGYVKVQTKENVIGYVEAKYIRSIDTQDNSDGRIAELEAEVKTSKQQSTDAITPEPSARPSPSSRTVAPAQSAQSRAPRPQHFDNVREYPKAEIFCGYNYVHLGNDAGSMDG